MFDSSLSARETFRDARSDASGRSLGTAICLKGFEMAPKGWRPTPRKPG